MSTNLKPFYLFLSLLLCPFLAVGQAIDTSTNLAQKSYFQNLLQTTPIETDMAVGGESGGGHFLEAQLARVATEVVNRLKSYNPHNLNFEDFKILVSKTKFEISDNLNEFKIQKNEKSFYKNAINYFPQKLRIKFYRPYWENEIVNKSDITNQLYNEFLAYFIGNDLTSTENSISSLMTDGIFMGVFTNAEASTACPVQVQIQKVKKTIRLTGLNLGSVMSCSENSGSIVFQCSGKSANVCAATTFDRQLLKLSITSADQILIFLDSDLLLLELRRQGPKTGFPRGGIEALPIYQAVDVYTDSDSDYSALCTQAFQNAQKKALQLCHYKLQNENCEMVSSRIAPRSNRRDATTCAIEVQVSPFKGQP